MLFQNVNLDPDGAAVKYVDYGWDRDGVSETVTWYELYRRMVNVALEIRRCAAPGDRAVILIPQGMDYIYAFSGCNAGRRYRGAAFAADGWGHR